MDKLEKRIEDLENKISHLKEILEILDDDLYKISNLVSEIRDDYNPFATENTFYSLLTSLMGNKNIYSGMKMQDLIEQVENEINNTLIFKDDKNLRSYLYTLQTYNESPSSGEVKFTYRDYRSFPFGMLSIMVKDEIAVDVTIQGRGGIRHWNPSDTAWEN